MKTSLLQRVVCLLMIYVLLVPQTWATCGGGGGGGMGGMGGGIEPADLSGAVEADHAARAGERRHGGVLVPGTGKQEIEKLQPAGVAHAATLFPQCVTMGIVDAQRRWGRSMSRMGKLPVALLVQADGTVVTKLENKNGKLKRGRPGKSWWKAR